MDLLTRLIRVRAGTSNSSGSRHIGVYAIIIIMQLQTQEEVFYCQWLDGGTNDTLKLVTDTKEIHN